MTKSKFGFAARREDRQRACLHAHYLIFGSDDPDEGTDFFSWLLDLVAHPSI